MSSIKQYIPNYVDGIDPETVKFFSTEELLKIPFVESWSKYPEFFQYSLSENLLMAEFKDGKEWWVVGYIYGDIIINLPKWKRS